MFYQYVCSFLLRFWLWILRQSWQENLVDLWALHLPTWLCCICCAVMSFWLDLQLPDDFSTQFSFFHQTCRPELSFSPLQVGIFSFASTCTVHPLMTFRVLVKLHWINVDILSIAVQQVDLDIAGIVLHRDPQKIRLPALTVESLEFYKECGIFAREAWIGKWECNPGIFLLALICTAPGKEGKTRGRSICNIWRGGSSKLGNGNNGKAGTANFGQSKLVWFWDHFTNSLLCAFLHRTRKTNQETRES